MSDYGPHSATMYRNRSFLRDGNGKPIVDGAFAYYLENKKFVRWLEKTAIGMGISIIDGTLIEVKMSDQGIQSVQLSDGRSLSADLFVDASGFRSELLGRGLADPFVSYKSSLWCDRAIVGGWTRQLQPIQPYTTLETMDAGWAWRIDHPRRINRGYVYCADFISDQDAEKEFRQKTPNVGSTHIVRFESGRRERAWVKNVVAIGNAFGFVEPLEATSLGMICHFSQTLGTLLHDGDCSMRESQRGLYNQIATRPFDNIRWFLSIHYKFNDRLDTAFWRECREKVDIGQASSIVEFFKENGPTTLLRTPVLDQADPFGTEGYLAILLGLKVPFYTSYTASSQDMKIWNDYRAAVGRLADQGLQLAEAMDELKSPQWNWDRRTFLQAPIITGSRV